MRKLSIAALVLGLAACTLPSGTQRGGPVTVATSGPIDLEAVGLGSCDGTIEVKAEGNGAGEHRFLGLRDGSLVTMAPMRVNVDGSDRAYHPTNAEAGAIIHLCNAGKVYLPDGTSYHGSKSNAVCTGQFMDDVARIREAGWDDPEVGAVNWYGILGEGTARIAGRTIRNVKPVEQRDGSGFFISPTALADDRFREDDQRRYVDALRVSHAVVRRDSEIPLGTFGVAWRTKGCATAGRCKPIPFIVGDIGPRIGEGSVALTRAVNGLPATLDINRRNRFSGNVAGDDVMWVFFGGVKAPGPYDQAMVREKASEAFEAWGGLSRLERCARGTDVPVAHGR